MLFRGSIGTIAVAALVTSIATAQAFDDAKYPDLSGLWRAVNLGVGGQAAFDPTKPWGRGQQAPLTPEYQAIHEASLADQANGGQGNWYSGSRCMPPGMPATMNVYGEMEIVLLPEVTHVLLNHNSGYHRRIYTDGRDWPKEVEPSFQGYSMGKWIDEDGDGRYGALEVETRGFKGPRTFEASGMPLHEDSATVIHERISLDRTDSGLLRNEVTVEDHALTRPWTINRVYRRENNPTWDFVDCAENNPHVLVGKEYYMISSDGYLMPTKRDQAAPDSRYFNRAAKAPAR